MPRLIGPRKPNKESRGRKKRQADANKIFRSFADNMRRRDQQRKRLHKVTPLRKKARPGPGPVGAGARGRRISNPKSHRV